MLWRQIIEAHTLLSILCTEYGQSVRSGCLIHNGTYLTLSLTLTIMLTLLTLTVTVRVWPKTRPGLLTLNAAQPSLKPGPAAHTVLHNRNATSHATSKQRRLVLLWREADHCPHANLTVAYTSALVSQFQSSTFGHEQSPNSTGIDRRAISAVAELLDLFREQLRCDTVSLTLWEVLFVLVI